MLEYKYQIGQTVTLKSNKTGKINDRNHRWYGSGAGATLSNVYLIDDTWYRENYIKVAEKTEGGEA